MKNLWSRIGMLFGVFFTLMLIFYCLRGAIPQLAGLLAVLPFSGGILSVLENVMMLDPALLQITGDKPFLLSLLVLLVQTAIQSPLLLLLNNVMGPILFRSNTTEYSAITDWNAKRAQQKIWTRLGKLLLLVLIIPGIAFLAGYLIDQAALWVGERPLIIRILIGVLVAAVLVVIVVLPFYISGIHDQYVRYGLNIIQRVAYVFITNVVIIATVASLESGMAFGQFLLMLLIAIAWLTIYSDTDGFLAGKLVRRHL